MDAAAYGFTDIERLRADLDASCVVGAVTYDEGAARLLTGQPELAGSRLCGPAALAAVHPTDLTWLMEHRLRAVRNGGLVRAEYRVLQSDGAVRWVLSRGRTYHDAAGRPARSHGILIDITEMRDGGERYVLGTEPMAENRLIRAVDLALSLKDLLDSDVPPKVGAAADRLLLSLGHAIARGTERYAH